MKRPLILFLLISSLVLSSSYLIYKYVKNTKSEKTSIYSSSLNSQPTEKKSEENKVIEEKETKIENNPEIYSIPNVEIKSLRHAEYDKKDKSKKIVDIKVDYLVIENKNNLEFINKLNDAFKKEAEESMKNAIKELSECVADFEKYMPNNEHRQVFEFTENSEIKKNNQNGIISVSSWIYEERGAAYPWYIANSYVVDCINGKKLNIFDIIKGNKDDIINMIKKETINYMLKIENESGNKISEKELKNQLYIDDKSHEDWCSQAFYLDNNSLVVEFSRSDIANAAWGMISVDIPYDNIKKYGLSIDSKFIENY